jgi:hypothetical protein
MKGTAMSNMTKDFHFPTPEELRAMEAAARRAQIEETLRLAGLAAKGVKGLVVRAVNALGKLRRRPGTIARHGA